MTIEIRTDEELAVLLGTLGNTADEVANKLRAAGIKGKKAEPTCCPIANWLWRETDASSVCADLDYVYGRWGTPGRTKSVTADSSDVVIEFMRRFDAGVYLDLVEQPEAAS